MQPPARPTDAISRRRLLQLAGGTTAGATFTSASCSSGEYPDGRRAQQRLSRYLDQQRPDPKGRRQNVRRNHLEATLTFWGWANDIPRAMSEQFRRFYPGVRFDFVDLSHEATHRKLQLSLHAGSAAPDLAMISDPQGPRFWDLGLLDLTAGLDAYRASFPSSKWQQVQRRDRSLQGVPWDAGPTTLIYRRDLFDRFGLSASDLTTWEALIEAGHKLITDSHDRVRMLQSNIATNTNGLNQQTMIGQFEVFCQLSGGGWFDDSGAVRLLGPANVTALNLTRRLRREGIARLDLGSAQAEFDVLKSGQVAAYIAPIWLKQTLIDNAPETKGRWGAIPLPAVTPGGVRAADLTGSSVAITEQSSHPIAAWEFLRFWLLRVDQRIASYRVGGLFENVFTPAAKDPFFSEPDPFFGGQSWLQLNSRISRQAPRFLPGSEFDEIKLEIETRLPEFVSGKIDAEQVLASAEEATTK